jgi:hypothetical protein
MASGDTLLIFTPLHNEPPSSNYATLDTRNQHPVLDFDASTDEEAVFSAVLPRNYGGSGITAYIHYAMSTATANEVVWQAAFELIGDADQDIDSDGFAAFNGSGAITVPGTSGNVDITTITFTNGADMDSVTVGDGFRFKVRRDADDTSATDDATGDAELLFVELKET